MQNVKVDVIYETFDWVDKVVIDQSIQGENGAFAGFAKWKVKIDQSIHAVQMIIKDAVYDANRWVVA